MSFQTWPATGYITHIEGREVPRPGRSPVHTRRVRAQRWTPPTPRGRTVTGIAVPYDEPIGARRDVYTTRTRWTVDNELVTLKLEHSAWLGFGSVAEAPSGLYFTGEVDGRVTRSVAGRHALSVGVDVIASHRQPDGSRHVDHARLREVSLVRHPEAETIAAVN